MRIAVMVNATVRTVMRRIEVIFFTRCTSIKNPLRPSFTRLPTRFSFTTYKIWLFGDSVFGYSVVRVLLSSHRLLRKSLFALVTGYWLRGGPETLCVHLAHDTGRAGEQQVIFAEGDKRRAHTNNE